MLGIDDSTAPIAAKRQSFLDNVIAQFDGVEHGMIDADRTLGHSEVVTQTVEGTDGEPIESKTVMVPRVTIVATGAMP